MKHLTKNIALLMTAMFAVSCSASDDIQGATLPLPEALLTLSPLLKTVVEWQRSAAAKKNWF